MMNSHESDVYGQYILCPETDPEDRRYPPEFDYDEDGTGTATCRECGAVVDRWIDEDFVEELGL